MISKGDYFNWYNRADVKFEMIKFLKGREVCLLSKNSDKTSVRSLKCHNVQMLDYIFSKTNAFVNVYNWYYSVAKYPDNNQFLHCMIDKRDSIGFKSYHNEIMLSYDLFIDVDLPDHSKESLTVGKYTILQIMNLFDKYKLPYEIRFSGKGFHLISDFKNLNNDNVETIDNLSVFHLCFKIAEHLNKHLSVLIDMSIYDSRRVLKIPYSISVYDKQSMVCLPLLSRTAVERFEYEQATLETWRDKTLRGRGTFIFNKNGNSFSKFKRERLNIYDLVNEIK